MNVTRREPRWVSHWKVQNSRFPAIRDDWARVAQPHSGWLSRQWHRLGRFPAETFGLSRTMRACLVPGKIVVATPSEVASVHTRPVSRLTSQCVRTPRREESRGRIPRGGRGPLEDVSYRVDEKYTIVRVSFSTVVTALCYSVESPAFLNFYLQNCISARSSIVICFNLLTEFFFILTAITADTDIRFYYDILERYACILLIFNFLFYVDCNKAN